MNKPRHVLFFYFFVAVLASMVLSACQQRHQPLPTVAAVDLALYAGKWYEIAAFPKWFEKGCHCTTAEYTVRNGYVDVLNSCREDSSTGPVKQANGKAFLVDRSQNAKLRVQFFWPFKGDYWILALAPDYSYVLIGEPKRESLWILSRSPQLAPSVYRQLTAKAQALGFDTSRLRKISQSCSDR